MPCAGSFHQLRSLVQSWSFGDLSTGMGKSSTYRLRKYEIVPFQKLRKLRSEFFNLPKQVIFQCCFFIVYVDSFCIIFLISYKEKGIQNSCPECWHLGLNRDNKIRVYDSEMDVCRVINIYRVPLFQKTWIARISRNFKIARTVKVKFKFN